MTAFPWWALAGLLALSLVVQGTMLRGYYRRKAAQQRARHLRYQQSATGRIQQAKRQIGFLQHELAALRLQLKQRTRLSAPAPSSDPAMQLLEREFDDAPHSRPTIPPDGFADTQPAAQLAKGAGLLLTA
jgi:hypothetical protein